MMSLLYFTSALKKAALTPADFAALGLSHALDEGRGQMNFVGTNTGPDGQPGLVFSYGRAKFDAENQKWRAGPKDAEGVARWHVGYWTAEKPTADDLARKTQYRGQLVRLQDGGDWLVPRCWCVFPDRPPTLSKLLDVDADGVTPVYRIHPRFEQLCEDAHGFWLEWTKQTDGEFDLKRQAKLAADALAANYRVGLVEAMGLLQLWSSDELGKILRATIEADEVEAFYAARQQKKTDSPAVASSTSSGEPANSPATSPATPT